MSDLISRIALLESLMHCDGLGRKSLDTVLQTINEQPTVDAVAVVHGEWLEFDIDYGGIPTVGYQCSECGQSNGFIADFCPNCGADMRKEGGVNENNGNSE